MTKINWKVYRSTDFYDLTQYVLDIQISWGRETFVSPYQGQIATITIKNDNQQADLFPINMYTRIDATTTPVFYGVVLTREFHDNPGNGAMSTCVITLVDAFTLAGNQQISTVFVDPNNQIYELGTNFTNSVFYWYLFGTTDTAFSVGAFSGNLQSQMQQIILADHGIFRFGQINTYIAPSLFNNLINYGASAVTYGRTASATQIAYESITRSEAAVESTWFNNATVTGALTTANKSNGSSATYGVKSFTLTSTQTEKVNSSAEWWANNYISPTRLSLDLTFLDIAQTETAILGVISEVFETCGYFSDVSWLIPGGASVTQKFFPDKVSIHATPDQTRVTLGMTNINTYQSFILNSATFGILDTSRLGVGTAV